MSYNPIKNLNKGYESNKQEAKNLISMNPLSKHMSTPFNMGGSKSAVMIKGAIKGDQSKTRSDYATESGKTDKGYKGETGASKGDQSASKADYKSPVNNGMKYDIKEASNMGLTPSARKHYAEDAQDDSKKGDRG
jgi:hypothetical protein